MIRISFTNHASDISEHVFRKSNWCAVHGGRRRFIVTIIVIIVVAMIALRD